MAFRDEQRITVLLGRNPKKRTWRGNSTKTWHRANIMLESGTMLVGEYRRRFGRYANPDLIYGVATGFLNVE